MGNKKNSQSALKHSKINQEIIDCIKKMQSLKLFTKGILSEDREYALLKDSKSNNSKISDKAVDQLSRYFFKYSFVQAKLKFRSIGQKINFEDLLSEANIGVLTAIKNFKLEKWGTQHENGAKLRFSSYAQWWIKNTLNNYCLKNSSSIKFITTKEDEKVFYNISKTINKLKLNKLCCDLNREEISKVATNLKVNETNIKKYINSVNISNSEKDLDNYFFNQSISESIKEQSQIDNNIDKINLLSEKELNIYNQYIAGHGLENLAEKFKSNKETIRQILISSTKKLNPEKNLI
jgi:RNA polymerase sigma-32 factor